MSLLPEIKNHYGDTLETELYVTLSVNNGNFLKVSKYIGIEIGTQEPTRASLIIKCKNATVPQEVAVEFDFDIQLIINATVDPKWKLYAKIPSISI